MNSTQKNLKMSILLLFFSTFLFEAQAKTTSDFNQTAEQISFYKSTNSRFPSGETHLDRLVQNQIQQVQTEDTFYFYNNQKISKSVLKVTTADDLSNNQKLRDLGFFLTLKNTPLKNKPDMKSKSKLIISTKTKFRAIGFENGFVQAKINNILGYIDISDCISKFDFARAVYARHPIKKKSQWFQVKSRKFDQIETTDKLMISMNSIEGLFPDSKKAIVTSSHQSLPIWTTLEIKTEQTNTWHKSKLDEHGIVYWKKPVFQTTTKKLIKIDELLKKDVSFVSFNPKNPRQAVASANGLYITLDGENWSLIEQFKNYTGPVLFYNEYLIYAGNYKSTDGGQSFENYIQIEKLSAAISKVLGYDPKKLQVKKIKTIKPFKVEVDLDIGNRLIKVQTPVYAQNWQVIKI
jgi:hypothetical protein